MQLYATRLAGDIPARDWQRLSGLVSKQRQEQIGRLRYRDDQARCLLAGLLLHRIILDRLGAVEVEFACNAYGKPNLVGYSDFHFNLSHAGHWIVCAVDDEPLGVDVEEMVTLDFISLAQVVFSPMEQKRLQGKGGFAQADYFYDIWTMKESYCKAVGLGFAMQPQQISLSLDAAGRGTLEPSDKIAWQLQQYELETGYKLAICASQAAAAQAVRQIDWRELIRRKDGDGDGQQ